MLENYRDVILENNMDFPGIVKFFNGEFTNIWISTCVKASESFFFHQTESEFFDEIGVRNQSRGLLGFSCEWEKVQLKLLLYRSPPRLENPGKKSGHLHIT